MARKTKDADAEEPDTDESEAGDDSATDDEDGGKGKDKGKDKDGKKDKKGKDDADEPEEEVSKRSQYIGLGLIASLVVGFSPLRDAFQGNGSFESAMFRFLACFVVCVFAASILGRMIDSAPEPEPEEGEEPNELDGSEPAPLGREDIGGLDGSAEGNEAEDIGGGEGGSADSTGTGGLADGPADGSPDVDRLGGAGLGGTTEPGSGQGLGQTSAGVGNVPG